MQKSRVVRVVGYSKSHASGCCSFRRRTVSSVVSSSSSSRRRYYSDASKQNTPQFRFRNSQSPKSIYSSSSIHSRSFSSSSTPPTAGLFSIPELQTPTDFLRLADQAIRECNQIRNEIATQVYNHSTTSTTNTTSMRQVLHLLDDISKVVCNVIDAAELCRNVHANPHWTQAAHQAFDTMSDYMTLLNADTNLYQALLLVQTTAASQPPPQNNHPRLLLSEEEERFVTLLKAEFENDGIHLPEEQREQVRDIQNEITQWESQFIRNLVQCGKPFSIQNYTDVYDLFSPTGLNAYGIETQSTKDPLTMHTTSDAPLLNTILKYSTSPNLRKQIYMELNTSVPENLDVLEHLRRLRHDLATRKGFASFAESRLVDKMARHPSTVTTFLQKAIRTNTPKYRFEMCQLIAAKRRVEGNTTIMSIEPWDISFYTAILKSSEGELQSKLAQYLTLPNTLEALQVLVQKLFGIEMKQETMAEEERWDRDPESGTIPPEHHKIRKFVFMSEDGTPLGTMYMDLHPRKNKYGNAAHFTVRCGCALKNSESEEEDVAYQLPIVTLVCSLSSTNDMGFMSHQEVETLLHEFGHGLHSLLSRTKFQHMAGTRASMDFVETPSHLFENFAWDPDFLKILGAHYASGDLIPDEIITALRKSRFEFAALERQNQLIYSLFDQKLFHVHENMSAMEIFRGLFAEYDVPYAENTHWFSRFAHLVTYGATYYGYQYAHVFSTDIWKTCFEGRSLQRQSGEQLWRKMLIYGGARDPNRMLHDLLGRPPDFSTYYSE